MRQNQNPRCTHRPILLYLTSQNDDGNGIVSELLSFTLDRLHKVLYVQRLFNYASRIRNLNSRVCLRNRNC